MKKKVEKVRRKKNVGFWLITLWMLGGVLTATGCGSSQTKANMLMETPTKTLGQAKTLPAELKQVHYHNFHSEVIEESTCTKHGKGADVCGECGFTQEYPLPLKEHQGGEWVIVFEATETKEGLRTLYCSECGTEIASEKLTVLPHEHSYVVVSEENPGCTEPGSKVYSCSVCGYSYTESIEPKGHGYGKEMVQAATCERDGYTYQVCQVCGQETQTGRIDKLSHNYGEWITTREANCTEGGMQIRTCVNCKAEETRIIPATGHKSDSYKVVLSPSCTMAGKEEAVCSVCGEKIEREIPAPGHDFVEGDVTDSTCTDEGVVNYTCSRCSATEQRVIRAKGHSASAWITDVAASCENAGSRHKECTVCNATMETEIIPALGHKYASAVTAPTCTAQGYTTKVCNTCGKTEITDYVDALGHKDGQWETVTPATCMAEGKRHKVCTVCGVERDTQVIEKTPHSFTAYGITREATEDVEGEKTAHCDTEGCDAIDTVSIPRLPHIHSYDTVIEEADATCETDGYTKKQCRCKEVLTTTIPKLGHDYQLSAHKDAECEVDGYDKYICGNCGSEQSNRIPSLGHTEGDWNLIEEATDEKAGLKVKYCTVCNKVLAEEEIAQLPHYHNWGSPVDGAGQPATCTTDGYELYRCKCGQEKRSPIPATNHKNAAWQVTKEATYTEMGLEERICPDCNATLETKNIPVKPHEHQYEMTKNVPATCTETGEIIETCSLCGATNSIILEPTGHKESSVIVDKEATCETGGKTHTECVVCHTVMTTSTTDVIGHTEGDWIIDSAANCETDGKKHKECTICGKTVLEETMDAVGHDYGDWIVDVEPTEDTQGHKYRECANCGEKIEEDVEVLPSHTHSYIERDRVDSTCTTEGHVTYCCEECGDEYTIPVNKKDHTPGEWQIEIPATEEADGLEVQKCTACKTLLNTRVMDKLEHTHQYRESRKNPTCTEDGYVKLECACGDSTITVLSATGHQYGEAIVEQPTCTEAGKSTIICEICGNKEETTIDAIGHNMKESSRKEPTCAMVGERVLVCGNGCGKTETETIPQLEHNYQVTSIILPTCTDEGYTLETCSLCADTRKTLTVPKLGHTLGEWEVTKEAVLGVDGERSRTCTVCGEVCETEKIDMLLTDGVDNVYYVEMEDGTKKMVLGHYDTVESDMIFDLVNEMREENGFAPLARADFQDFSDTRALELAVLWGHDRPNGKQFSYAENVAMAGGSHSADFAVAQYFVDNWENSSGHKANMLGPSYKYTGVSVFYHLNSMAYWKNGEKEYEVYSAQNFSAFTREQENKIIHGDCEDL